MIVTRKERETNQQVLRRFNRATQADQRLKKARDNKFFTKEPNRFARRMAALRKEVLRRTKQWY